MTTEHDFPLIDEETAKRPCAVYVLPSHDALVAIRFGIREIESYLLRCRVEHRGPALDPLHGVQRTVDPVGVQALDPKGSVDRFNQCIVSRLPGIRDVDLDLFVISRQVQGLPGELAAVTIEQLLRSATFLLQPV